MKKTIFECDICREHGQDIFEAKIQVQKTILCNGEREHISNPIELIYQICSLDCLQKAVAMKIGHVLTKIPTKEAKNG